MPEVYKNKHAAKMLASVSPKIASKILLAKENRKKMKVQTQIQIQIWVGTQIFLNKVQDGSIKANKRRSWQSNNKKKDRYF